MSSDAIPGGAEISEEWEVAWFPFDKKDQTRRYTSESTARTKYREEAAAGTNPILSHREVIILPWDIVENSV